MSKKKIVIIGAGDFGREVAYTIERINESLALGDKWDIYGFIDDDIEIQGKIIDDYPVIGTIDWLNQHKEKIYAVCSLGTGAIRKKVIDKIQNNNVKFATIIDPEAKIFKECDIGEGSIICANSILAINTKIGKHVVINLACTLGHDDIVEDYCVINPGCNISGKVRIGKSTDLGTGTKVIQGIKIGEHTTIGAGTVVIREVPDNVVAVGVPANIVREKDRG
jgi:sugar O-acyltransferase (sialic acid O-acetyltransferase NeuD family)